MEEGWVAPLTRLFDRTSPQLRSGWVRVVMSKALLISVTGDRHDVPVWDSCIRPQSYGCRPDAMVGVELRQGCCFADVFHHGVERVHSDCTRFIPDVVVETPVLSWILEKRLALRV